LSLGIFAEIERLIENIPIDNDIPNIGRLVEGTSIDSQFYFKDIDGIATRLGVLEIGKKTISLRDIVRLFNKFLIDANVEEIVCKRHYKQLHSSGSGLPLKNLLFDFCLAALVGERLDAKLYLTHSFYLLGLHRRLTLLLSVIVNESSLTNDKDIRQLLTLLAIMTEPNNVDIYFDAHGDGFNKRYSIYLQELQKLMQFNKELTKIKEINANQ
jgi:hypothetical protein